VADGAIYVTGNKGEEQMLIRLGLDGKEVWRVAQGPRSNHRQYPGARSTPTVDGGRIYVTGGGGRVTCHEAADGKVVWAREMKNEMGGQVGGWQYAESVLILGDLAVVTPGGDHAIVALDNQHEQGRGTISNVSLDLDIDDADCRLDRIVLIRSLTPAAPGAPPVRTERQTNNRWDGIYIEGDVKLCDRTKLLDIATEGRTPGTLTLGPRFAQHPRLPREFPGFIVKKA
jgi:hypothetical protein